MKMKKDQKSKSSYKSVGGGGHNSSAEGGGHDSNSDNSDISDAENEDETPKIDYRISSAANHARCGHHGGHGGPSSAANYHSHVPPSQQSARNATYSASNSNQKTMSTGSSSSPLSSTSSSSTATVSSSSSSSSTPNSVTVNILNTNTLSSLLNNNNVGPSPSPDMGYAKYQMGSGSVGDSQYYQVSGNNTSEGYYSSDSGMMHFKNFNLKVFFLLNILFF